MSSIKDSYDKEGFVIVPGLVSAADFPKLRAACQSVTSKTRLGQWKRRRVVGKQFPPFDSSNPDSWGVQHIMHPDLGQPIFEEWYGSEKLLEVVEELIDCKEEHLQMELFNLLINPTSHDFALRWHRDDVSETASEEEERAALAIQHYGVQWNTALYDDSCLFVVPRTHNTPRTQEQRALSSTQVAPERPLDMPGSIQVHLRAGHTVFYNNNILHCAQYSSSSERATLHACIGDVRGGTRRARNILQHDLDWMRSEEFGNGLPEKMKPMWKRLLDMASSVEGQKLGFSLEG